MYDELIKRLRDIAQNNGNIKSNYIGLSLLQAADAIEELAKESERWQAEAKDWYLAYMGLLPTREESEKRKHGKWTDPADLICYKCTACGMYANQGYGLDEPIFWDYCPNCGAEMEN